MLVGLRCLFSRKTLFRLPALRSLVGLWAVICLGGVTPASALDAQAAFVHKQSPAYGYELSFAELGRFSEITLRGVQDRQGVAFSVRADEAVKRVRLVLSYTYSQEMLDAFSHLNILLNGEAIKTIPLLKGEHSAPLEYELNLPLQFLKPYNQLEVQLIGHYTLDCENPIHPSLWANIGGSSRLVFDVAPMLLPNDLSGLPTPFFDPRDIRRQKLVFVLPNAGDRKLEAAGAMASWFGALAGYRGTQFAVSESVLPEKGHAVVLLTPTDRLQGLNVPDIQGASLAMVANPNDAFGKLLLVMGRNEEELKAAALALVLGGDTLTGPLALVKEVKERPPRVPYDAPNWLPTDRPVELGELLAERDLSASGRAPGPIAVSLRLPPDLSDWQANGVPLDLRYRYSPGSVPVQSSLTVLVNHQPIKQIDISARADTVAGSLLGTGVPTARERIQVPLSALSSQASLQFQFHYQHDPQTDCRGSIVDVKRSAIDPESSIDLSGFRHYAAMPDLASFGTAGFPFTRLADLSETVVVLPARASAYDYVAYLSLLGKFGESTAYPATGVTVTSTPEASALKNKEILFINSGEPHALLAGWLRHLPRPSAGRGYVARFADWSSRFVGAGDKPTSFGVDKEEGMFAGFESPLSSGRSVVLVSAGSDEGLRRAVELLTSSRGYETRMQGSLAIVRDQRIESLSSERSYYIGRLGVFRSAQWFFARQPLALVFIYMFGALLVGAVLYLTLRTRARHRLRIK